MKPEAIVAVVTRGDTILFIRRGPSVPDAGYWAPLSGTIEPGESQEAAVIREVQEEVGVVVQPRRKVWEHVSASGSHILHWWLADYVEGDLILDRREVSEARWVTVDDIAELEQTFAGDREFFHNIFPCL